MRIAVVTAALLVLLFIMGDGILRFDLKQYPPDSTPLESTRIDSPLHAPRALLAPTHPLKSAHPLDSIESSPLLSPQSPISPRQMPTDTPSDTPIQVLTHTGDTLCYIPTFSLGAEHNSYIGLLNCSLPDALPARYDVFGRIGFFINRTWLCITAPDSVAVWQRGRDYAYLAPCVINAPQQQWKLKDGSFSSLDERYSLKDDGSYLYAAHILHGDLYTHRLADSMAKWASLKATAGSLVISGSIAWDLAHKDGQERYFLYNNASSKSTTTLYFNLASGHIAQYEPLSGTLACMYAPKGVKTWAWVHWGLCDDSAPPWENLAYFRFIPISGESFAIVDSAGNRLRLARYGAQWGVPYVAAAGYIPSDRGNSPTSSFILSASASDFLRFSFANLGRNLPYCPAPGHTGRKPKPLLESSLNSRALDSRAGRERKSKATSQVLDSRALDFHPSNSRTSPKALDSRALAPTGSNLKPLTQAPPPLPQDFRLSEQWIQRLYDIATTTGEREEAVGVCGACLLQAFQAIAELLYDHENPPQSGGYFFDTGYHQDPFASFRARNSLLHDTLRDIIAYYMREAHTSEEYFLRAIERTQASAISLLPQYDWRAVGAGFTPADRAELLGRILNAPAGSVFLLTLGRHNPNTDRTSGHAVAALRLRGGVVIIPANTPYLTHEAFHNRLLPLRSTQELEEMLTRFGSGHLELVALGVLEVGGVYHNPYDSLLSLRDCSGEGEDRRGNGLLPLPELLNQCISGRCEW